MWTTSLDTNTVIQHVHARTPMNKLQFHMRKCITLSFQNKKHRYPPKTGTVAKKLKRYNVK